MFRFAASMAAMMVSVYLWAKIAHLVGVIGWMATVFAMAAALRRVADEGEAGATRERFVVFGLSAYRLGHHLFGWAVVLGLVLWLYVGIGGAWLHAKLAVVALLLAHFIVGGRLLKRAKREGRYPSRVWALWYGRAPAALLLVVVWLVLGKPF